MRSNAPKADPFSAPVRPPGIGASTVGLAALLLASVLEDFSRWSRLIAQGPLAITLLCAYGVAGLCLWHYWKGRNWARLAVLLWAVVAVAQAIAFLGDHNLAALMARPLSFFSSLVAVALLYWLNVPPVRAWFRKLSSGPAALVAERLVGRICTGVEYHPADAAHPQAWHISFEHGAEVVLYCPWRIVLDDNLAFVYSPAADSAAAPITRSELENASMSDPEPNPVPDSLQEARRLLKNLRVTALRVAPRSSDLLLTFEMGIDLQTWLPESSSGAQWTFYGPGIVVAADENGIKPCANPAEPADQPAHR